MDIGNIEELEQLIQDRKNEKEAKDAYWERILRVCRHGVVSKPKGLFVKKCPRCSKKLKKEHQWSEDYGEADYIKHKAYTCLCGYEFAQ